MPPDKWTVVLYYAYVSIDDFEAFHANQVELMKRLDLLGRVLVAPEGINGTLAGPSVDGKVEEYIAAMKRDPRFAGVDWKLSGSDVKPFSDLNVQCVKSIAGWGATMDVDPRYGGKHLSPEEFHAAVIDANSSAIEEGQNAEQQQDAVVLDVRNHFEHSIGHFQGAVSPGIQHICNFQSWVDDNHTDLEGKKVLMYCTGGVRCEKASAYLLQKEGVSDVYQLSGGIHRYLEAFPDGGVFEGKNFVFDVRVTQPVKGTSAGPSKVVGQCCLCGAGHDVPRPQDVCAVCKAPCLACGTCRGTHAELHCSNHIHLRNCYFWFLEVFSAAELRTQYAELEAIKKTLLGHKQKNCRKTLQRQLDRLQTRIELLETGIATHTPDSPNRCRWCEKHIGAAKLCEDGEGLLCDGRCWGFWKAPCEKRNFSNGCADGLAAKDACS